MPRAGVFTTIRWLLLDDANRKDEVARADVIDHIDTLDNLTEAGVHAIEVLCVHTVMADEELRTAGIWATMSHREHATVVILTLGACLTGDGVTWASCAVALGAATLDDKVGDDTVEGKGVVEAALGKFYKIGNSDGRLLLVELHLHITLLGRDDCVFHSVVVIVLLVLLNILTARDALQWQRYKKSSNVQ